MFFVSFVCVRRLIQKAEMEKLPHVVVIGTGVAGLAAATRLLQEPARATVTLIDSLSQPGGIISSTRKDSWLIERSADSFLAVRPEGIDMAKQLGIESELIAIEPRVRRALIWSRGRLRSVPKGFRIVAPGERWAMLQSDLLSWPAKLRLLSEPWIARRMATGDESLEDFAVRRLGREVFDRIVQPLASGIWTADPQRLSMFAALPEFVAMEQQHGSLTVGEAIRRKETAMALHTSGANSSFIESDLPSGARYGQFVTFRDGMGQLPQAMAQRVLTAGGCFVVDRVESIAHRDGKGWNISTRAGATSLHADAVILAVPAWSAGSLMRTIDMELSNELSGIEYAGSTVVSMGFEKSDIQHALDASGIVVPRSEGRRVLAISFLSSKFPGRAPAGHALVRVFVGGALDPEAVAMSDQATESLVINELKTLIGVSGLPKIVQIDRWNRCMPQYHVGHVERVNRIRKLLSKNPSLALAGSAYQGVGIPQVIRSGTDAAEQVCQSFANQDSTAGNN